MGYSPWSCKGRTWPSYRRVTFLRAPPAPESPRIPALVPFVDSVPPPRASACPGPMLRCLTAVRVPLCHPQLWDLELQPAFLWAVIFPPRGSGAGRPLSSLP